MLKNENKAVLNPYLKEVVDFFNDYYVVDKFVYLSNFHKSDILKNKSTYKVGVKIINNGFIVVDFLCDGTNSLQYSFKLDKKSGLINVTALCEESIVIPVPFDFVGIICDSFLNAFITKVDDKMLVKITCEDIEKEISDINKEILKNEKELDRIKNEIASVLGEIAEDIKKISK